MALRNTDKSDIFITISSDERVRIEVKFSSWWYSWNLSEFADSKGYQGELPDSDVQIERQRRLSWLTTDSLYSGEERLS